MKNLQLKASWLAIASASLVLAACGGDDSSSSSIEKLTYSGSEEEAVVDESNSTSIATAATNVTLAMEGSNSVSYLSYGMLASGSTASVKEAAKFVADLETSYIESATTASGKEAPAAVLEVSTNGSTSTNSYEYEGECGGSMSMDRVSSSKQTYGEDEESDPQVDTYDSEYGEDYTMKYEDFCVYMDEEELTELHINGSTTYSSTYKYSRDDIADTRNEEFSGAGKSSLSVEMDGVSFDVVMEREATYIADRAYDEEADEDLYDPETYVNEERRDMKVSGDDFSATWTYVETCELDEDLMGSSCEESELLKVGGITYKVDGYASTNGNVNLTVFIPSQGSVSVTSGSSYPQLCEDLSAFESGQLSINSGEILVDFSGCEDEPVVTYQGVSEVAPD